MTAVKELLTFFLVFHFCLAKRAAANTNTHHGCERRDKYSEIGYDKGNFVSVNIGVCQTGASKTLYNCLPLNSTEERHLLYNGYFVIKAYTIEACQRVSTACRRLPHFVLFYPGTAYSRRIDIGVCGGRCRENNQPCKPVWNKTEGISTPNGIRSIQTIVNCSCVTPYCYRVSNFEAFPEQAFPDANGKTATKTKLVDMGKCVSESVCPGGNRNGFLPVVTKCGGDTFKQHAFVSEGGRQVNVSAIATCSCHYPRN